MTLLKGLAAACVLASITAPLWTGAAAMVPRPPVFRPGTVVQPAAADGTLGMALMGALVSQSGHLIRGAGATGAEEGTPAGTYHVFFSRDVSQCYYSAASYSHEALAVDLEPLSGNANGVFLRLITSDGTKTSAEEQFYLTVFCGQ